MESTVLRAFALLKIYSFWKTSYLLLDCFALIDIIDMNTFIDTYGYFLKTKFIDW